MQANRPAQTPPPAPPAAAVLADGQAEREVADTARRQLRRQRRAGAHRVKVLPLNARVLGPVRHHLRAGDREAGRQGSRQKGRGATGERGARGEGRQGSREKGRGEGVAG